MGRQKPKADKSRWTMTEAAEALGIPAGSYRVVTVLVVEHEIPTETVGRQELLDAAGMERLRKVYAAYAAKLERRGRRTAAAIA